MINEALLINAMDSMRVGLKAILTGMINSERCSREEMILIGAYIGANFIRSSSREVQVMDKQKVLQQVYLAYLEICPQWFRPSQMRKISKKFFELLREDIDSIHFYIHEVVNTYVPLTENEHC